MMKERMKMSPLLRILAVICFALALFGVAGVISPVTLGLLLWCLSTLA